MSGISIEEEVPVAQLPRPLQPPAGASAHPHPQPDATTETSVRHIRLLSTLHDTLSTLAGRPDIERDLQPLVSAISNRFNFSTIAVGVIEGDELVFSGVVSRDFPRDLRLPLSRGICGRVIHNRVGELVDDVSADPDYEQISGHVRREACVPIIVNGDVWGVLNVEATDDVVLGHDEFDVLQTLATSLGLAIERSRQQRAESSRHNQLARLQQLAGRIAGRVDVAADDEDLLDQIAGAFGYSSIGLGIVRGHSMDSYYSYSALLGGAPPAGTFPMAGVAGKVARTGKAVFAHDVREEADYVNFRPETTQEICVPVRAAGVVVGVLNVEATSEQTLDDTDLDLLLTLGDHLGTAISNHFRIAELERRNQQLHLVDRVTSLIAGHVTILDALPLVLEELEGAFGFGSSGIGLVEGDHINFVAIYDSHADTIRDYFITHGVSIETGVTGRVARTGQPIFIDDVHNHVDYLPTSPEVQHEICVPIMLDGRTIGVLNVETPASQRLVPSDVETLSTIANHLGMAFGRSEAYEAERRSKLAMEAIQRVSTIVSSILDSDEALNRIVATLADAFSYPFVSINLIDGEQRDVAAWHGLADDLSPPTLVLGVGVSGRVAATGIAELALAITDNDLRAVSRPDTTSQIAVPIRCAGSLAGVLTVEGIERQPLSQHDLELLQTFAEHAGTTITNARRYEEVQELAMRDPITGLPNYRQFQSRLQSELSRSDRHNRPLALLVIDLDGFKGINDAFGHLAGDEVLREVGVRLAGELRESDVVARYAGDEFVVILPETPSSIARRIADRLGVVVTSRPFSISSGHTVALAISIGVATYPTDATTLDDLIRFADSAMYRIKRNVVYPDMTSTT